MKTRIAPVLGLTLLASFAPPALAAPCSAPTALSASASATAGPKLKAWLKKNLTPDKIAAAVSVAGKIATVAGEPQIGAPAAVAEAIYDLVTGKDEQDSSAMQTPRDDFDVLGPLGPATLSSYSYTGLVFTDPDLQALAQSIAVDGAELYANRQALVPAVQRYYGALAAGDPVATSFTETLSAGLADDFAGDTELASPGSEVSLTCSGTKPFDQLTHDSCFAHTFADLPDGIVGATLEIRLAADGLACNDTISLQASSDGSSLAWSRRIGSNCLGDQIPGLLSYGWGNGNAETLFLDLSALPNADGSTTDLLALIDADDRLDVRVNNDTGCDYAVLHVSYLDGAQAGKTYSEIQREQVVELVQSGAASAMDLAEGLEALAVYAAAQGIEISQADVDAFEADVVANGLPATELAVLQEMGATADEIQDATQVEVDALTSIEPFEGTWPAEDLLQVLAYQIRAGEALSPVASLPADFPLTNQVGPIDCQGTSFEGSLGVAVSCDAGVVGIEILTGSGQIIIKPIQQETEDLRAAWIAVGLDDIDSDALPVHAQLLGSSTYFTGADAYAAEAAVTKVGTGQFELTSDFSAMGATTKTVQAYLGVDLVQTVTGVDLYVPEGTSPSVPKKMGPGSSTGWYAYGPSCPEWRREWPFPVPVLLPTGETVLATALVVTPEVAAEAPQWYFSEVAIETQLIPSYTIQTASFGPTAPFCQESLGYASDPTARITVCGGDLSSGTSATLDLFGAPPFGQTVLFVGLVGNPTPFDFLGGASLVPYPFASWHVLPVDGNGTHSIPIQGGLGALTIYVQEMILGPNTVTNAVAIDFLP